VYKLRDRWGDLPVGPFVELSQANLAATKRAREQGRIIVINGCNQAWIVFPNGAMKRAPEKKGPYA
jgi:hypothetical protein